MWQQYCTKTADIKIGQANCLDLLVGISTLNDIAKEASGTDEKVKLETRESVLELAWTASLSCRDAQNEVTIDFYFRHENN